MKKAIIKVVAVLIITVLSVGFFAQVNVEAHEACSGIPSCPPDTNHWCNPATNEWMCLPGEEITQ